ncbi:MAG: hypothetical protein KAR40_18000 [Candidatus Sabulitectum sp.]|nr:hypothetical protein [Candidatus Sabulitectum sp.]
MICRKRNKISMIVVFTIYAVLTVIMYQLDKGIAEQMNLYYCFGPQYIAVIIGLAIYAALEALYGIAEEYMPQYRQIWQTAPISIEKHFAYQVRSLLIKTHAVATMMIIVASYCTAVVIHYEVDINGIMQMALGIVQVAIVLSAFNTLANTLVKGALIMPFTIIIPVMMARNAVTGDVLSSDRYVYTLSEYLMPIGIGYSNIVNGFLHKGLVETGYEGMFWLAESDNYAINLYPIIWSMLIIVVAYSLARNMCKK